MRSFLFFFNLLYNFDYLFFLNFLFFENIKIKFIIVYYYDLSLIVITLNQELIELHHKLLNIIKRTNSLFLII